jgi:hydrogenase maturation protease
MRPLLIGVGNPDRGDDALGIELISSLERRREGRADLLCMLQLEPELVLDLRGRELVLIVDASHTAPPPCCCRQIRVQRGHAVFTHSLGADDLLSLYRQQFGRGPDCFLLEIRGEGFVLGSPLSAAAADHLQHALRLVEALLRRPDLANWGGHCND